MGVEGIVEAINLSIWGGEFEELLKEVCGLSKTVNNVNQPRMEKTRYHWESLRKKLGSERSTSVAA
jgi:hypothetical protein